MTAHEHGPTAAAPAAIEIDWIWGTPRGYIIRVEGHAFGPMSFDDLRHFPRWLFRRLFELKDYELDVALVVSRRLNDLKRGEWQLLLVRSDNWLVRWRASLDFDCIARGHNKVAAPHAGAASWG